MEGNIPVESSSTTSLSSPVESISTKQITNVENMNKINTTADASISAQQQHSHKRKKKLSVNSKNNGGSSGITPRKIKRSRKSSNNNIHSKEGGGNNIMYSMNGGNASDGSGSGYSSASSFSSDSSGGSSSEGEEEDVLLFGNNANRKISTINKKDATSKYNSNSHHDHNMDQSGSKALSRSVNSTNSAAKEAFSPDRKKSSNDHSSGNSPLRVNASVLSQPIGWRVKLYRLNADGSWDDCGTGRITCSCTEPPITSSSTANTTTDAFVDEVLIYHQLGDPTLCVRAEISSTQHQGSTSNNNGDGEETTTIEDADSKLSISSNFNTHPKILLKTRVLLRQVYNRQGDNIITWREPFFQGLDSNIDTDEHRDNTDNGVDLALSFQENTGCLEIWNQINEVQTRAEELLRQHGISNNSSVSVAGNFSSSSEDSNDSLMSSNSDSTAGDHDEDGRSSPCAEGSPSSLVDGDGINSIQFNAAAAAAANQHQRMRQIFGSNHAPPTTATTDRPFDDEEHYPDTDGKSAVSIAAVAAAAAFGSNLCSNVHSHHQQMHNNSPFADAAGGLILSPSLPIPSLSNLEEISDLIAAAQMQQRESLTTYLSNNDCLYLKQLLNLFPSAEDKGDFGILATLAACIKSILLLNDPQIIELIALDEEVFESLCSALEYDPDLSVKGNHRWFIRERLKFKTVVKMEDEELIFCIHRCFRANFIRDTLLRPTMDESSLSTLSSLLQFTHGEIVRRVTDCKCASSSPNNSKKETGGVSEPNKESYLIQVLKMLGTEVREIRKLENELELRTAQSNLNRGLAQAPAQKNPNPLNGHAVESPVDFSTSSPTSPIINSPTDKSSSTLWKQHLVPQDSSLSSRKIRRIGCLSFLRELFNMVRGSLQQSTKDDYFTMVVFLDIQLDDPDSDPNTEIRENGIASPSFPNTVDTVNLLSLLGSILSDPKSSLQDRSACLEILFTVSMHDPALIRRHCLDEYTTNLSLMQNNERQYLKRPEPDQHHRVLFLCKSHDLLLSLLFILAVENDAGILLQTSEIMRLILDTEMIEQGPLAGCVEDELSSTSTGNLEQNKFLSLFYEHYIYWLVVPFQYTILTSRLSPPFQSINDASSNRLPYLEYTEKRSKCSIRSSFSVELLCFCVRAHCYRMKFFVIKNRVLGSILKLLNIATESSGYAGGGGDRCLKLASLR